MSDIPFNISEEEYFSVLREFLGTDDMDTIRQAHRDGVFKGQDMIQGIEEIVKARQLERGSTTIPIKEEAHESEHESENEEKKKHHKKKKKKHSKDKKKDKHKDKEERKEKTPVVKVENSSDSEDNSHQKKKKIKFENASDSEENNHHKKKNVKIENGSDSDGHRKHHKKKKERKKVVYISSSSDSEDDREEKRKEKVKVKFEDNEKKEPAPSSSQAKDPSPSSKEAVEVKREKSPERKPEPKPFSKYQSFVSRTYLNRWRPVLHRDHLKYQRKFRLKPCSIVCVDLLDFPMLFHHPRKHSRNPNSVPLKSGTELDSDTQLMLRRLERDKASWYKGKLNKKALKFLRGSKHGGHDDERKHKKRLNSTSDSDSSGAPAPSKKARKDDHRDKSGGRPKAGKDDLKSKMAELKRKVEQKTRTLAWENKGSSSKMAKIPPVKGKPELAKIKDAAFDKKRRLEQLQKLKLDEKKNAPSVTFQRILKQIETANREQSSKPKVELKIPKKNTNAGDGDKPVPLSEYKLQNIGVNDVYKEVRTLLCKNVLVECPNMPTDVNGLGEYTVKKIAWWILKNEKEPAPEGLCHPEFHDDDEVESHHEDDFEWDSDMSSIVGCVSDPEGVGADVPPDPNKVADPDWADDYCGEASLCARFRRQTPQETESKKYPLDSMEPFKTFLRTKPGTNYTKPTFEVKCFLCNELVSGQRRFGAHIRSAAHKNNFRNYSLELANYEENIVQPEPRKVFTARLVEYTNNPSAGPSINGKQDVQEETKLQIGKIEHVRSDSPGPIVAGDAAPNIETHQVAIPDDISLPSIEDYDISSDESLMNVRVVLRTSGKWNDDLEKRWRTWKDEEAKLAEGYEADRECFINQPERYPGYQEEWMKFWDKRSAEVEAEGKDPDAYDYQKEWMPFWLKRMQELMQANVERRNADLKRSLGIDKHLLRRKFGISAEATKRKKQKRKVGNLVEQYASSMKSLETVQVPDPMPPEIAKSNELSKLHSKSACDKTSSAPDGGRIRLREGRNDSDRESESGSRKRKPESRVREDTERKGDRHHHDRHRGNRDKDKHIRSDKHHESGNRRHKDRHRDHDKDHKSSRHESRHKRSSRSPEKVHSKSKLPETRKSASPVSSVEPPPPGEDVPVNRSGKPTKPPPPVISDKIPSQAIEVNKRIDEELKERLGNISKDEKIGENVTSSLRSASSNEDKPSKKRPRESSASDISSYSNVSANEQRLLDRALKIREALANEFHATETPSQRPKVIPIESSKKSAKLSDGEVASDVSELSINQGMSSFLNKDIPGLHNLTRVTPSASKPGQPGHHGQEKKTTDDNRQRSDRDWSRQDRKDRKRHQKSEKHEKRHQNDDRNRHKNDRRHSKDDRHTEKNPQDRDYRANRDTHPNGSGKDMDYRNPNPNFNSRSASAQSPHQNIPSVLSSNFVPIGPRPDAWADESWDAPPQCPGAGGQIPVVGTPYPPHPQYPPSYNPNQQNQWRNPGPWQGYPPTNNYYNNNY